MTEIIDYAMPLIKIEQLIRAIHDDCLRNDYAAAQRKTASLITESRMLSNNLQLMQDE
jgi:hypothetical protein